MKKQYALVCENKNEYQLIKKWANEIVCLCHNIEIIFNPMPDINKYDSVLLVYENECKNDCDIFNSWVGHSHIVTVAGSDEVKKKKAFFDAFCHTAGIPAPVEIERKYLIEYPDIEYLNSLPNCKGVDISQSYLDVPYKNVRIRKRNGIYIKTEKSKITDLIRQETESLISEQEYNRLLAYKNPDLETVCKTRYCLLLDGKYFEIDVFPFWSNVAYLEIELISEDEKVELPPFVKVIKEVTFDKRYTNKSLAKRLKQNTIDEL